MNLIFFYKQNFHIWNICRTFAVPKQTTSIIKCKELQKQLSELIEKYYEEYYADSYQKYEGWRFVENSNKIIISYSFWDICDERNYDEYEVTFEELSNFKPNNYWHY